MDATSKINKPPKTKENIDFQKGETLTAQQIANKNNSTIEEIKVKVEFLNGIISERLVTFDSLKSWNRKKAILFKIISSLLGAIIAILLGLKLDPEFKDITVNIALILGSFISIVNAIEVFWNPMSLWIKYTMTSNELHCLHSDINYLMKKDIDKISINEIDDMYKRYSSILKETNLSWENTRTKINKK